MQNTHSTGMADGKFEFNSLENFSIIMIIIYQGWK